MAEYKVNYTQSNFTGGIIAAELYGRNDFNKVKSGLKQCVNWTIREAGGLEFRRGTEYINTLPVTLKTSFKTASIDNVLVVFGEKNIWWYSNTTGETGELQYPDGIGEHSVEKLQFTELQRRLYIYDGKIVLCHIELIEDEPVILISKFDGELPEENAISLKAEGKQPDPAVLIDYTYAFSVAKDESHESVATISDVLPGINAELGAGSSVSGEESQRIDITINLTQDVIDSNKGGKVLIYKKYQGKFYYLDSLFIEEGKYEYKYSDQGQITPDISKAIKTLPSYMNPDGSIGGGDFGGVTSIADYGQRLFMTLSEFGTNIVFSQVGNTDSLAYSELRNEDEAGYLEVPISHYDNWCKVVAGLDLIFSTSYTISQIQGYGDLQLQTVLFDGFSKTVQPVTTRRSMIYTNSNNRNIYDLTYNEYGQYDGIDLTLLVKYIFETKTIKRLAFKDYPVKTIYVLCDDGDLYCLTYIKDQNIYAWYQIKHEGKIHDLLVINRDTEDEIYMVIETDRLQYTESYDWHEGVGENAEAYDNLVSSIANLPTINYTVWYKATGSVCTESRYPKPGDRLYDSSLGSYVGTVVSYDASADAIYMEGLEGQPIIFSNSDKTGKAKAYGVFDDNGIRRAIDSAGRKICLPDQAEKVIALYESDGIKDYIVLDDTNHRFWGLGYTEEQIPAYIIERAYHRTDNIYMDSVVMKRRTNIVNNKITGLPAHMIGKKVRVFDLGNNQYYGKYDNANSKSITQGGVVVQIDDVDFNGYEVAPDGSIQLEDYIELEGDVLVGFPYYAVAETIPLEFSDQNGNSTIGRKKNITEAYLRYGDSRGLSYKTLGKEYDCKIPSKEISDTAEFLERGQMRLDVASEYKWDSTIKILQREPYPARIESITLGLHFNDKS